MNANALLNKNKIVQKEIGNKRMFITSIVPFVDVSVSSVSTVLLKFIMFCILRHKRMRNCKQQLMHSEATVVLAAVSDHFIMNRGFSEGFCIRVKLP